MKNKIGAIGLSSYQKNNKKKSNIVKEIANRPDKSLSYIDDENNISLEQYGYFGSDFGIVVYGKLLQDDAIKVMKWSPFAYSSNFISALDIAFEKIDGEIYAFCEEEESGNELEFKVNNISEYNLFVKRHGKKFAEKLNINFAGLCSSGKILFPTIKNDEAIKIQAENELLYKDLIKKLRQGDLSAEKELTQNSMKISSFLKERLKDEDIYSVFESYFLPHSENVSAFGLLGDILEVESFRNTYTNEIVVKLLINATNSTFNVFINKNDLIGMPSVGMRFSGVCTLQGNVDFQL